VPLTLVYTATSCFSGHEVPLWPRGALVAARVTRPCVRLVCALCSRRKARARHKAHSLARHKAHSLARHNLARHKAHSLARHKAHSLATHLGLIPFPSQLQPLKPNEAKKKGVTHKRRRHKSTKGGDATPPKEETQHHQRRRRKPTKIGDA